MGFPSFKFGENWKSFSKIVDVSRLSQARNSLEYFIGQGGIQGNSFLDIGCGSGLFAIAAHQLGASKVVGIDIDPISVETSIENASKWIPDDTITFFEMSILDEDAMDSLGYFDVVYSWGVLHHTGSMKRAIESAAKRVKPGGKYYIAIYNRHFTSGIWRIIKLVYNILPKIFQELVTWLMIPIILLAKLIYTRRNPLNMTRGMDFTHNVIDWVGGYPYEYASIDEMKEFLSSIGLGVERVSPALVPTGCNEYLCIKSNSLDDAA